MSGGRIEPVEPSLGAVFLEERRAAGPPAASKARVLAKLGASITALPAPAQAPAAPPPAAPPLRSIPSWLRMVGTLAIGGAIGGGAVAILREPHVVYVDRMITAPGPAPSAPASVSMPELLVPSAPSAAPVITPTPSASAAPDTLARERALLDDARSALRKESPAEALAVAQRHEREFPRGHLAEEREAIAIQSLVKLGRNGEALTRGARFRTERPSSVLMPAIDVALDRAGEKSPPRQ